MELLFQQKSKSERLINALLYVFIAFLILLIIFFNLVIFCGIVGDSMNNTLKNDQHVLLLKGKNAQKDDIIVFKHGDKNLIKRVIAVEGQRLVFATDLNQQYVWLYFKTLDGYKRADEGEERQMLYQNFAYSFDNFLRGRYNVYKSDTLDLFLYDIDDQYVITVEPNCYFVMGDNRNNSSDSRDFGLVKKSAVAGRLFYTFKSGSFLEKLFLSVYGKKTAT